MEWWNDGILSIKNGKHITFSSGAPRLSITEFTLRNEGPEAQGKRFLTFSLESAAGGRSSNLYQGNTYPWTHHSSGSQVPEFSPNQKVTKIAPIKLRKV